MPKSAMRRVAEAMREIDSEFFTAEMLEEMPFGLPDEAVTTEIDGRGHAAAKLDALRAHRSQVSLDTPWFTAAGSLGAEAIGIEHFLLKAGPRGIAGRGVPAAAGGIGEPYDREDDLFAGIG